MSNISLLDFVEESNRIEGILSISGHEIRAHEGLLALEQVRVDDLEEFVEIVADAKLRVRRGMKVYVGDRQPPAGGPLIKKNLNRILEAIQEERLTPYEAHVAYELLHPFTDGNGRSGRALWLWQMQRLGLEDPFIRPFLHSFYYQALSAARG